MVDRRDLFRGLIALAAAPLLKLLPAPDIWDDLPWGGEEIFYSVFDDPTS